LSVPSLLDLLLLCWTMHLVVTDALDPFRNVLD